MSEFQLVTSQQDKEKFWLDMGRPDDTPIEHTIDPSQGPVLKRPFKIVALAFEAWRKTQDRIREGLGALSVQKLDQPTMPHDIEGGQNG